MSRPTSFDLATARRIALAAQGFTRPRPSGRVDRRHLTSVLTDMSVIQIDSVNVLVRSQELPVFARLGTHDRDLIPRATTKGDLFEYWGHAAAHVRTEHHRLWRWKMESSVGGPWQSIRGLRKRRPGYVERVFERVASGGPVTANELSERTERKGPWWDWDDAKEALEYLFMCGRLTATRRPNDFARVYDLPERVIPAHHLRAPTPSREDAHRELVDLAGRSLGIATAYDLADYFRLKLSDVKPRLAELVEDGRLRPVDVESWRERAYLHTEARVPRRVTASALLSMFDPVVWNRRRDEMLFDFHYRIEIYTPAPRRRFGYYVLPFLHDERIAARVDLKADRVTGRLLVLGAFAEPHADRRATAVALRDELRGMAEWLGLERVTVGRRGDLSSALRK